MRNKKQETVEVVRERERERELQFSEISKERGITLVALVVTIIVIIILATVSINAVFSENGIIKKAQLAKNMQANSIVAEEEGMNRLLEEYANMMEEQPAKTNYEIITPINIISYENVEYLSPGEKFQFQFKNIETGEIINSEDIIWSANREDVQIDKNGIVQLSDDCKYGTVEIKGKYQDQQLNYTLVTLHRLQLSNTNIVPTKYTTSDKDSLFTQNTYAINNKLNIGIVPGEQGYILMRCRQNGLTTVDLLEGVLDDSYNGLYYIKIDACVEGSALIPIKFNAQLIKKDGEEISEVVQLNYIMRDSSPEGMMKTIGVLIPQNPVLMKLTFSIPKWSELSYEEIGQMIYLMSSNETTVKMDLFNTLVQVD